MTERISSHPRFRRDEGGSVQCLVIGFCLALGHFAEGANDRIPLSANHEVDVEIPSDGPDITTERLRPHAEFGPLRGVEVDFIVDAPGVYTIEARAISCDAYLILRDPDGAVVAEDDNGWLNTQPRIVTECSRAGTYRVGVGTWREWSSPCTIRVLAGRPTDRSPAERREAALLDAHACAREAEASFGEADSRTAWSIHALGLVQQAQGRFVDAEASFRKAAAIRDSVLGERHRDSMESWNSVAVVLNRQGRCVEAEKEHRRVLDRRERFLGPRDIDTAGSHGGVGVALAGQGCFGDAEKCFRTAFEINLEVLGADRTSTVGSLYNLAEVLARQLRWAEAEGLHRRVLDFRMREDPPVPMELVNSQLGLGGALAAQGRVEEAIEWLRSALALSTRELGPTHPATVGSKLRLGMSLASFGRTDEAEPLLRSALDDYEHSPGPASAKWAEAASALGVTLIKAGRQAEGDAWMERSLNVRVALRGNASADDPGLVSTRAALAYRKQSIAEAEALFRRALANCSTTNISLASPRCFILGSLVRILAADARIEEAAALQRELFTSDVEYGIREACVSPRDVRASRTLGARDELFRLITLEADRSAAFDDVARWKGLTYRVAAEARRSTSQSGGSEALEELLRQDRNLSGRMSMLAFGREPMRVEDRRSRLAELQERRRAVEREIALLRGMRGDLDGTSRGDIESALDESTAYVDFLVWSPCRLGTVADGRMQFDAWEPPRVAAWIVRGAPGRTKYVDLGLESELDSALLDALAEIAPSLRGRPVAVTSREQTTAAMLALRRVLWDPLAAHLDGVTHLIVSPDGQIAEFPFDAIDIGRGRRLIEAMNVTFVSDPGSLHDLLRGANRERGTAPSLLAVGGVSFEGRADAVASSPIPRDDRESVDDGRGFTQTWGALPWTRVEVESVMTLFRRSHAADVDVLPLTGSEATEDAVKRHAPGRTLLHFATHGFYQRAGLRSVWASYDPVRQARADEFIQWSEAQNETVELAEPETAVSPGFLTGLVFAAANGPSTAVGADDGILTADEIERLDLSACELAVLSACETALGAESPGEGLCSLRRAFGSAGARAIVSTFWQVHDAATLELMTEFYRRLLDQKQSPATALRGAKLHLLRNTEWNEPRHWAAFTLAGDWR